jgi:hypothetical protein
MNYEEAQKAKEEAEATLKKYADLQDIYKQFEFDNNIDFIRALLELETEENRMRIFESS